MFEPLAMPEHTDAGYWVVTVQSDKYLQLHDDAKLHTDMNLYQTSPYFDTECEAFFTSQIYYVAHEKLYPYLSEWGVAVNSAYNKYFNILESQPMEFK